MMGCSVAELYQRMSHRELLYHLEDLKQDPPWFDTMNKFFAVLNKNILMCSMSGKNAKQAIKTDDYLLTVGKNAKKKLSKSDIDAKARADKYRKI